MYIQIKALLTSFIGTIILGLIVVPILKKLKIGQVVRDDGPQTHLRKSGTPTMGGIIILAVTLVVSLAVATAYPKIMPVALLTVGFGFVGFIDDFIKLVLKNPKGLKPSLKMLGLVVISVIFVIYLREIDFGTETYIPILKEYIVLQEWVYIPGVIFVMLACTNSLNLTDGLDGLAGGVSAIIMIFFTFVSVTLGDRAMAAFSGIMVGTSIGFLMFNIHPAKVFMGDTGSLALGGAFCGVAIMLKMPLILIIVAGVCVWEAVSDIIQVVYFKVTKGKRFFKMAPFHHHLELSGWKENKIVSCLWLVTALLCLLGVCII